MDSESPLAFGIAGQVADDTGISFTAIAGTFKSEFGSGFGRDRTAGTRGRRSRLPRSHPYRHPADGDGR
ncbi:MAG: hypothetical protein ABEJ81_06840 [Haloferacaceae archaeon]